MNNIFKCSGIVCLVLFSFFYTEKAVSITNEKDPIMKSILVYKEKQTNRCSEGQITTEGAILGVSGKEVNVSRSYGNMKGIGFSEDLLVYDEEKCDVNSESEMNNYIIGGNKVKNSISLLVLVNDTTYLEKIVNICEEKNVKVSFIVSGSIFETNKDFFYDAYNKGFDILYNGTDEADFKKYRTILKSITNEKGYCVSTDKNNLLNMCSHYKINTIRTNIVVEKDLLRNIKGNLNKGNFIIIKENNYVLEELSSTINFIKAKGLNIKTITTHISDEI